MGIPEPSEEDFIYIIEYLKNPNWELKHNGEYIRVIAHLIRNGAVLVDYVRADDQEEESYGCYSLLHGERRDDKLANAVSLFERLKGRCDE